MPVTPDAAVQKRGKGKPVKYKPKVIVLGSVSEHSFSICHHTLLQEYRNLKDSRIFAVLATLTTQIQALRTTTKAEREGLQEMVIAIGEAFQRAKSRGSSDGVHHYMCLPSNRSMLPLVRHLQKNDKDYRPGIWFTGSK